MKGNLIRNFNNGQLYVVHDVSKDFSTLVTNGGLLVKVNTKDLEGYFKTYDVLGIVNIIPEYELFGFIDSLEIIEVAGEYKRFITLSSGKKAEMQLSLCDKYSRTFRLWVYDGCWITKEDNLTAQEVIHELYKLTGGLKSETL